MNHDLARFLTEHDFLDGREIRSQNRLQVVGAGIQPVKEESALLVVTLFPVSLSQKLPGGAGWKMLESDRRFFALEVKRG